MPRQQNDAAIATYDSLIKAKTDEVDALTAAIEDKTKRVGELGLSLVQMKGDLSHSEEALIADTKYFGRVDEELRNQGGRVGCHRQISLSGDVGLGSSRSSTMTMSSRRSRRPCQAQAPALSKRRSALVEAACGNKKSDRQTIDFIMLTLKEARRSSNCLTRWLHF